MNKIFLRIEKINRVKNIISFISIFSAFSCIPVFSSLTEALYQRFCWNFIKFDTMELTLFQKLIQFNCHHINLQILESLDIESLLNLALTSRFHHRLIKSFYLLNETRNLKNLYLLDHNHDVPLGKLFMASG